MSDYVPYTREERSALMAKNDDYVRTIASRNWTNRLANSFAAAVPGVDEPVYTLAIDVSHWNPEIDLNLVRQSGVRGIYIKLTESTGYIDPTAKKRFEDALAADLIPTFYAFFRANKGGAVQADWFLEALEPMLAISNKILRVKWDFETVDGITDKNLRNTRMNLAMANTRDGLLGRIASPVPEAYSAPWFWDTHVGNVGWINNFYGWIAHWTGASAPTLCAGWKQEIVNDWQYGVCPRYSWSPCPFPALGAEWDVNRYYGTPDDMKAEAGIVTVPGDLEARVAALEQGFEDLNVLLSRLQGDFMELEQELGAVETQLVNLGIDVEGLNSRVTAAELSLVQVQEKVAKLLLHTHIGGPIL